MTADKTEVTVKKTAATNKTLAKAKRAAKTAVKQPVQKTGAKPKLAVKKSKKEPKSKMVRDSFSMPKAEYQKIAEIKEACLKAGLHVKKSTVLRAGLKVLGGMNAAQLKRAIAGMENVKSVRPKNHKV